MDVRVFVLNLTTDCNLRCTYCYADAGKHQKYMTIATAKQVVDKIIRYTSSARILFHGGEPTLCMDIIEYIVRRFDDYKHVFTPEYYIQTNGQKIDDRMSKFFCDNKIRVCVSLDGSDTFSNSCRISIIGENSLSRIKDAINTLKHNYNEVTVLSVITKVNYLNVNNFVDFLVANQISDFSYNHFISGGRGAVNYHLTLTTNELLEFTKKLIFAIDDINKKHQKRVIMERNIYHLIRNVLVKRKRFMCMNQPCGAGIKLLGITPLGDLYPCDDFSNVEFFKLGNIYDFEIKDIIDSDIIRYFAYCSYDEISECKSCEYKDICGAGCASRKYYYSGSIYDVDPLCDYFKQIIPYIKDLIMNEKIDLTYYK